MKEILLKDPPYDARVEVKDVRAGFGWTAPKYDEFLEKAIEDSSKIFYKNEALKIGEGGSIPLMNSLSKMWP